ncbi:MAG: capsid cement protein [Sulfuritalea sp.]|nr:DUF2190 family protein [Hyphomicrobiales bacterium]MDZ4251323.1 capsid cement protein [Sulfuritalea sp.]
MKRAFNLIAAFVAQALALWAEFGEQLTIPGLSAAADLSGASGGNKKYVVVRMAATTTVNICSEVLVAGALKSPLGVLQNEPKSGEAAIVACLGLSKVRAGGTVTAGSMIAHNSSGMVVDAVSGDVVCGRALETATTANEIATAFLFPPVKWGSVA